MTVSTRITSRKMASAVREASRQIPAGWPGGFFLTDPERVPDPVAMVWRLPHGVGVIHRHFGADNRFHIATKLKAVCFHKGIPLLIANDPYTAIAVNADGVHWPEAHAYRARKWRGRFQFQTQSVHSATGLRRAVCDAVLFSTVFPSNSPSAGTAIGAIRFRKLAMRSEGIVYALGGVNGKTARAVSGVAGLAGIEGYFTPKP